MTIKVMVIDDSSVVRQVITDLLVPCLDIDLIATAADPIFAMGKMRGNWPDVILDPPDDVKEAARFDLVSPGRALVAWRIAFAGQA